MDNNTLSESSEWHVLYTKPHCEMQVQAEFEARGIEVYLPVLPAATIRRDRPAFQPFFPCYVFARFNLKEIGISRVNWTRGMRYLVTFGGEAAHVDDAVIQYIRDQLAEGWFPKHGDRVIIRTEVRDIEAVFDKCLSASGRVQVLVDCLQRWTVNASQVHRKDSPRLNLPHT